MVIQYSTQFSSDTWQTLTEVDDPAVKGRKQIQLSPWLRYTFRAVAVNDIGNSTPSAQSSSIQTPAAGTCLTPLHQVWLKADKPWLNHTYKALKNEK